MKKFTKIVASIACIAVSALALIGCGSNSSASFEYLDFKDSSTKLEEGVISAGFITAGAPTAALTTLATGYNFKLMEIDDAHADELIKKYPFYTKYTIPGNTYSCIKDDVKTVAILATLVASDSMSEDQVYKITKALFTETFNHAQASNIEINQAIAGIGNVPMHPGAAKYYAEALSFETVEEFASAKGVTVSTLSGSADKDAIKFATGGTSGTYYAFGGVLATQINTATGLNIVPQAANGSGANLQDLKEGNVDIAWSQNDVMNYAYNGTDMYEGKDAVKGYSAIGAVYPETCQIPANVNIKSWDDLKDKKIAVGAVGSGVYFNAKQILSVYGIEVK